MLPLLLSFCLDQMSRHFQMERAAARLIELSLLLLQLLWAWALKEPLSVGVDVPLA